MIYFLGERCCTWGLKYKRPAEDGGNAKNITTCTENGGASKTARDRCSDHSWCELRPSDRRSSSSVHQLVLYPWEWRAGEDTKRLAGSTNKQTKHVMHHVPPSPLTHSEALAQAVASVSERRCLYGYLPPLNHTCPLCKDYTSPTNVCLQPHPILCADQFGRGFSLGLRVDPVSTGPPSRTYLVLTISHSHSIRMAVYPMVCNPFTRDSHRTVLPCFPELKFSRTANCCRLGPPF